MYRTVVVIDDNKLARWLTSDALRAMGYEPQAYASAGEALLAVKREHPVACIVDQFMPDMSGAAFVRELRRDADPVVRSIPVIGLTAGGERELLAAGANHCLRKPLSEQLLASRLAAIVPGEPPARGAERPPRGGAGTPSASSALAEIQSLHRRYRDGQLNAAEVLLYRTLRSDFTRMVGATQQLGVLVPARRRRSARIAVALEVNVLTSRGPIKGKTTDIGPGGFSAVLVSPVAVREAVRFTVQCMSGELTGEARVVNVQQFGPAEHRTGFSFRDLPAAQVERLETLVLDAVLSQLGDGQ